MAVSWEPGCEDVPDCNDLIERLTSTSFKGPNIVAYGVNVGGGEISRTYTPPTEKSVTKELEEANQKYKGLCRLLPTYAHGRKEDFYKARDDMSELIKGSKNVATAVATLTGQSPPASLPTLPTAATDAAKTAGVDPSTGVSNPSPSPAQPPAPPKAISSNQATRAKGQVKSVVKELKEIVKKPLPNKATSTGRTNTRR